MVRRGKIDHSQQDFIGCFRSLLGSWIDIASSYTYQEQPGRDCVYFNHAVHHTFTALRCLCRTAEPSKTRCYMLLPNGQSDRYCEAVAACCRWLVSGPNPSDQGDFLRFHANPCSMLLDSQHWSMSNQFFHVELLFLIDIKERKPTAIKGAQWPWC